MNKSNVYISKERIKKKVKDLADDISHDYKNKRLILIGVLKGSFIFLADLARYISIPVQIDFIQVSSYGKKAKPSQIKLKKDLEVNVSGKHVIIIDDIVDYGYTAHYLINLLHRKKAASVEICTLLDKPSRRKIIVPIKYYGFEIPDKFVVGYGLDFAERLRNLSEIKSISR